MLGAVINFFIQQKNEDSNGQNQKIIDRFRSRGIN